MTTVLILVHLMVVIALVVVVLLQRSEGGALGIGGGGGGAISQRGTADGMTRTTGVLAAVFFATSIALGVLAQGNNRADDVLNTIDMTAPIVVPGAPATAPTGNDAGGVLDELNSLARPEPTPAPAPAPAPVPAPTTD